MLIKILDCILINVRYECDVVGLRQKWVEVDHKSRSISFLTGVVGPEAEATRPDLVHCKLRPSVGASARRKRPRESHARRHRRGYRPFLHPESHLLLRYSCSCTLNRIASDCESRGCSYRRSLSTRTGAKTKRCVFWCGGPDFAGFCKPLGETFLDFTYLNS